MTPRDEMVLRMGFYAGCAQRDPGDSSYYERWSGRAHELTQEEYELTVAEIHARLLAAGKIHADEDPFESFMHGRKQKGPAVSGEAFD